MLRIDKLLFCFLLAYIIVFLLEIIQVIVKIKFFSMKPLDTDLMMYLKRIKYGDHYLLLLYLVYLDMHMIVVYLS